MDRALMQLARARSDLLMLAPSLRRFELWMPVRGRVRVRVRGQVRVGAPSRVGVRVRVRVGAPLRFRIRALLRAFDDHARLAI